MGGFKYFQKKITLWCNNSFGRKCQLHCRHFPMHLLLKLETWLMATSNLFVSLSPYPPPPSLTYRKQDGRIRRISDEVEPPLAHSRPPFLSPSLSKVIQGFDLLLLLFSLIRFAFAFRHSAKNPTRTMWNWGFYHLKLRLTQFHW